jgi:hypothetical protein
LPVYFVNYVIREDGKKIFLLFRHINFNFRSNPYISVGTDPYTMEIVVRGTDPYDMEPWYRCVFLILPALKIETNPENGSVRY